MFVRVVVRRAHPAIRVDVVAGSGVRALLEEQLGATFATLAIALELASNDAIVSAVEAGLGVAFLPRRTAERANVHAVAPCLVR